MRSVVQNVSLKNHKKALRYLSNGSSRRFIPSNVKRLPSCMYIDNVIYIIIIIIMKGNKVQTLGARAVAGACCMAGCLGHNYYYGHGCNY